jgi:apolipoprotein N-acyltransferase
MLRPGRGEGFAVLSGLLLWLSFPKFGHGAVAWIALVPLLLAIAGARPGQAARLGYTTGVVASIGLVYWTSLVVVQFGGLSMPVGIGVMLLLCCALGLFPALFAYLLALWLRRFGPRALLLAPVAWVATEILRAHTLFNFAWCLLGYSQHAHLPFIQSARFVAVYGVSFLVMAINALLALAAADTHPRARRTCLTAAPLLLALTWAHGAWAMSRPVPESGRVRVGLVQASIEQQEKWDPALAWENLGKHLELTREAAARGARFVVWPESSAPGYFDRSPALAEALRGAARGQQIYLLFGNDDREAVDDAPDRMWVGAKMLTPTGELPYRYHKVRLVPFGEYVPLQPLFTLGGRVGAKMVNQVSDFTPGDEYTVGTVDGHRVGAFICYEAIFADLAREFTAQGAELLVNMTNDGWYGRTSAPYQHLAMARFRAVENGRYLVRAANTGFTAVVDPRGRILEQTQLFEPALVVREVPFVAERTFYSRHGDIFAWGCLALSVALVTASLRRRRVTLPA